jgi:hypothetical protein
MKKTFTKTHGKLVISHETIRHLAGRDLRAVNGGLQSGHETCDSGFCDTLASCKTCYASACCL